MSPETKFSSGTTVLISLPPFFNLNIFLRLLPFSSIISSFCLCLFPILLSIELMVCEQFNFIRQIFLQMGHGNIRILALSRNLAIKPFQNIKICKSVPWIFPGHNPKYYLTILSTSISFKSNVNILIYYFTNLQKLDINFLFFLKLYYLN